MTLGAGWLGVEEGVVAFKKPNADPPLDSPTLEASVEGAAAAATLGSAALLFTSIFPNKSFDTDDGAAAATGAASAEIEKLPSRSPLLSVDSVDTNAGAAGEFVEGSTVITFPPPPPLFIVIPPNMESPPDTFATDVTAAGGGGGAATGAGMSDGPSKSNKLGASATKAVVVEATDAAPLLFILVGDEGVAAPGAIPSNPNTLLAGALTDCLA
jgi:hypothetical protein